MCLKRIKVDFWGDHLAKTCHKLDVNVFTAVTVGFTK